jgi:hypothetical protein
MTYEAKVELKFDATWTSSSSFYGKSIPEDDFLPEEHYCITAPAADLNCKQYFKLFEKFLLCVGMHPDSIRSGAMSLVFNDWVREDEQRKVCKEYELTMDEDLEQKYLDFKKRDEDWAKLEKNEPKIKGDWDTMTDEEREHQWEISYWRIYRRFQNFAKYTDEQLKEIVDLYESKSQYTDEELDAMCDKAASDEEKRKCQEYNLREAEYYNQRAKLDLQQQTDLIGLD